MGGLDWMDGWPWVCCGCVGVGDEWVVSGVSGASGCPWVMDVRRLWAAESHFLRSNRVTVRHKLRIGNQQSTIVIARLCRRAQQGRCAEES
jgi:hypothetical protein